MLGSGLPCLAMRRSRTALSACGSLAWVFPVFWWNGGGGGDCDGGGSDGGGVLVSHAGVCGFTKGVYYKVHFILLLSVVYSPTFIKKLQNNTTFTNLKCQCSVFKLQIMCLTSY